MIRVVADANVLISAALAGSPTAPSALVLDAALDGRIELVSSPSLLAEITSVLARVSACDATSPWMRPSASSPTSPRRPR